MGLGRWRLPYPPSKALPVFVKLVAAIALTVLLTTSTPASATTPHGVKPAPRVIAEMIRSEALHHQHLADLFAILKRHRDAVLYRAWMAYAATHAPKPTGYGYVDGILVCNGTTLPTCLIVQRESGFNPHARNPRSSAGGLYQMLLGTFRGICPDDEARYGNAANAPVAVQVKCAAILWDHGRGSGAWALTR